MHLRLGGARADRAPADQVGDVLRADHVEVFGAGGHAHFADGQQQLARGAQAVVDLEAAVHVRVVDQTLPAHRGARLFEVHPHHHLQLAGEALALHLEQLGVFERGAGIVDRARADDDDQPVIHAVQDAVHGLARAVDHVRSLFGAAELADQVRGRQQLLEFADAQVVGVLQHDGSRILVRS